MKVTVEPGSINGVIKTPPSKSMTQRVYAAALLHRGKTMISGAGNSEDERAALGIVQQLGARVISNIDGVIAIESSGVAPVSNIIHCGESGLAARLFIPIAAMSNWEMTITGTGTLLQRTMSIYDVVLPELGVTIISNSGYLPITVKGPLVPANITIDGSESSQFLSGLLFAFCYSQEKPVYEIKVAELASKPYVMMTMQVLELFGNLARSSGEWAVFTACNNEQSITPKEIAVTVEGDWSSAANWLVAGAIAGEVIVSGLMRNDIQADSAIYTVLKDAGADIDWVNDSVVVKKARMRAFEFDATDCPDLFPILAMLAACCEGESYITGVHRLFAKESNRAQSISEMLENFDVPFSIEEDMFCIEGVKKLQGTVIDAQQDHRIVMAAAIGALRASGPVDIEGAEAVNKSYPGFFTELERCFGKPIL